MSHDTPDHGEAISRMVAQGIAIPDLATMYGMSQEDVKEALALVKPIRGKQIRTAVYALWDALGALRGSDEGGVSAEQLADYISKMKPSQLPVALQEAFWSAQIKRQKFEEERGDLWRTAAVMKVISELLRVARQSMTLMVDNVDQQTALTPRQREIVRAIGDSVLADMRERVIESFNGWDGSEDKDDADPSKYAREPNDG